MKLTTLLYILAMSLNNHKLRLSRRSMTPDEIDSYKCVRLFNTKLPWRAVASVREALAGHSV